MKKLYFFFFLLTHSSTLVSQNSCTKTIEFAFQQICFPELDGMNECYDDDLYKIFVDEFKTSNDEIILAFYMSDNDHLNFYENILSENQILNDPYFKIFTTKIFENIYIDESNLDVVEESFINSMAEIDNFSFSDSTDTDNILKNISIQTPLLLDNYKLRNNIRTIIFLMYFNINNELSKATTVMHLIIIKNRLFFIAFYDKYKDYSTIKKLEAKSNSIAEKFLNINK